MEGIGIRNGIYSIVEYEDRDNVPKEVLIPYPAHCNIAELILPEVYYLNTELRFEWKNTWSYYDLPVLNIFYQNIIVQRIPNASSEVVVVFLNEFKSVELSTIRERQVQTLSSENDKLKNRLDSSKTEIEILKKMNKEILAKIK